MEGLLTSARRAAASAAAWLLFACSPSEYEDIVLEDQVRLQEGVPASLAAGGPDDYLQFVNQQANVPSGDYVVLVTPRQAAAASFSVSAAVATGAAAALREMDCPDAVAPAESAAGGCYALTQPEPGGLRVSVSPPSNYAVELLDRSGLRVSAPLIEALDSALSAPRSRVDNPSYAEAYYNAMDPQRSRRTLGDWLAANGFGPDGSGCDVHLVFRDVRDLGYGRNMCMRQNPDGSTAFWVRNYLVSVEFPGGADSGAYGNALSLEAAIGENSRFHVGTNAIEFSAYPRAPDPDDPPRPFAKFFTFLPSGELDMTPNLDGRGARAMPGACIVCHNGAARTLVASTGTAAVARIERAFRNDGDVGAKLQPLDVPDLGYSSRAGFTRSDLEAGIRRINIAVYCTYPGTELDAVCVREFPELGEVSMGQPDAKPGDWGAGVMRELVAGWYGGEGFPSPVYAPGFVPSGWIGADDLQRPEFARKLFLEVVGPHCIVCHGSRGQSWGDDKTPVDFASYADFLGYEAQTTAYVFELGIMPLSLQNHRALFAKPDALDTLSSALPSYVERFADLTEVIPPGSRNPVADAGPPRRVNASAVTLSAGASRYADRYAWRLADSRGADVRLLGSTRENARLVVAEGATGTYTVELVVSRSGIESRPSELVVEFVADAGPKPDELRFHPHIRELLQQPLRGAPACVQCHTQEPARGNEFPAIPVWFTDAQPPGLSLYEAALEFVDFRNLRWSELLVRPTGYNHVGGEQAGFDVDGNIDGDASRYHMLVNWILNGALEGDPES